MTQLQTGRLLDAARFTERNPESHQAAAWNRLQEHLTPEQIDEFFGVFRSGPTRPPVQVPPMAELIAATTGDAANTWEGIEMAARIAGAKFPALVAAQWALESNWGREPAAPNNHFGLKALGGGVVKQTKEEDTGNVREVTARFMTFLSIRAGVEYLVSRWYRDFEGYKGVNRAGTIEEAARLLMVEGYATDKRTPEDPLDYRDKLLRILRGRGVVGAETPVAATPRLITIPGMAGPRKTPYDFGFKAGDSHLIVDDRAQTLTAWSFEGGKLFQVPAIARGQGGDKEWKRNGEDTPPGLYRLGQVWDDYGRVGASPSYALELMQYGWTFVDMVELENQERTHGRSGVGIHGGGSALGWPGAWAPKQRLVPTRGCVRCHNSDVRDRVLPLMTTGTVYMSVFQEI